MVIASIFSKETAMTFIVVNKLNAFQPSFQVEYNTFEEAEAVAHAALNTDPKAQLCVAEVKKKYTAEVVITAQDPTPVAAEEPVE